MNKDKIIEQYNSGNHTFTLGVTKFTDLTHKEFSDHIGFKPYFDLHRSNFNFKCLIQHQISTKNRPY